jgi:hypothetical protein
MNIFKGIFRYEYRMSLKRWGLLIGFALMALFYIFLQITASSENIVFAAMSTRELWQYAGTLGFRLNAFLPVVVGIMAADRVQRDLTLQVWELLESTRMNRWTYILGKYFGVLFSMLTPALVMVLLLSGFAVFKGAQLIFAVHLFTAFLVIMVPAYAFVLAYSLVCPLFMPVRVYQVLFTGYWYWGNFISPEAFPTINGTIVTASGLFALEGFFGTSIADKAEMISGAQAGLNLLVLTGLIGLALFVLEKLLARRASGNA